MEELKRRSGGCCELCGSSAGLGVLAVDPGVEGDASTSVVVCEVCGPGATSGEPLEGAHWFCLQQSIWSEVPAVQVLSFRLLHRMVGQAWAADLLAQVYLDDETRSWAERDLAPAGEPSAVPVDSHGTPLADGDSVTLIKDLVVKGANFTAKRGTLVKNIRLGDDPTHVEGRVDKVVIMLKTEFLKRAG
jgi:protein PhnA